MKKFKFFEKFKFSSSGSSSGCSSSSSHGSLKEAAIVEDKKIDEKPETTLYEQQEQENTMPKIQMRIKKRQDNIRLNRFSAHVSLNSTLSSSYNNKRYSAADFNNIKEITYIYKILIIGNSGVGKTSLMNRFCNNAFMQTYIDTIGVDFKTKIIKLIPDFVTDCRRKTLKRSSSAFIQKQQSFDNEALRVKLQIWDTTGAQRFQSIALNYYRGANGILLVYDVNDRKSFECVKKWMKAVSDYCTEKVEVCLVANKCDAIGHANSQRKVTQLEGETLASMYGLRYIETSAKSNINIEKAFVDLTKNIKKKLEIASQVSKHEEHNYSIKNRTDRFKINSKRKFSTLFNSKSFISCFVCNSRQLPENT